MVTRAFDVFFDLHLNKLLNDRDTGDLRRHRDHYDVTVMTSDGIAYWRINTPPASSG